MWRIRSLHGWEGFRDCTCLGGFHSRTKKTELSNVLEDSHAALNLVKVLNEGGETGVASDTGQRGVGAVNAVFLFERRWVAGAWAPRGQGEGGTSPIQERGRDVTYSRTLIRAADISELQLYWARQIFNDLPSQCKQLVERGRTSGCGLHHDFQPFTVALVLLA